MIDNSNFIIIPTAKQSLFIRLIVKLMPRRKIEISDTMHRFYAKKLIKKYYVLK